jgi:L-fucono-1,5-lactonase
MIIDSHQHFWRYDPQRDHWITDEMAVLKQDFLPGDLVPQLCANGVDGSIVVQADQSERETMFLLDLAAQFGEIKGVVGWVNLCGADLPWRLEYFSRFEKLCGFRHVVQTEPDDRFMLHEDFLTGIEHLQRFNFSYDILIYPRQLPAAVELVRRFPRQRFVIDHAAKPSIRSRVISPWEQQMRAIATNPNVYCKLSGLITEADWDNWRKADFRPYLDVVFDAFGPDRLMFGSDWPVCLLAGSYAAVKDLIADYICDLPMTQQEKIFGLTAASFYGLKTSHHEPATAG